jgi:hypothetical protein
MQVRQIGVWSRLALGASVLAIALTGCGGSQSARQERIDHENCTRILAERGQADDKQAYTGCRERLARYQRDQAIAASGR